MIDSHKIDSAIFIKNDDIFNIQDSRIVVIDRKILNINN